MEELDEMVKVFCSTVKVAEIDVRAFVDFLDKQGYKVIRVKKEEVLLDFLKKNVGKTVTVDLIRDSLGEQYLGGLGKLISADKVEKYKVKGTNLKLLKCFRLKGTSRE